MISTIIIVFTLIALAIYSVLGWAAMVIVMAVAFAAAIVTIIGILMALVYLTALVRGIIHG